MTKKNSHNNIYVITNFKKKKIITVQKIKNDLHFFYIKIKKKKKIKSGLAGWLI